MDAIAAGFEVVAIDAFADADTKQFAYQVICVAQVNGNFDTVDFLNRLQEVQLECCIGLIYGSGFEGNIELLTALEQQLPLIGNLPQTVAMVKNPVGFFDVLSQLNIACPEVCFSNLQDKQGWLIKRNVGSGGMYVKRAQADTLLQEGDYFQREIVADGQCATPVSLLFLADGRCAEAIGFNWQLLASAEVTPFRYGGVVSQYNVADETRQELCNIADKLTLHYGLRGLNSLDVMLVSDGFSEQILVLEINPRLSASVGLYQFKKTHLLKLHVESCNKKAEHKLKSSQVNATSIAHGVFYAPFDMVISPEKIWPSWVVDIPGVNSKIKKDEPVCSVIASADNFELVYEMLLIRLAELQQILLNQ